MMQLRLLLPAHPSDHLSLHPAHRLLPNRFPETRSDPVSPAHPIRHFQPLDPPIASQSYLGTRPSRGDRGATFSEVMVAAVLTSIGLVGAMGAFEAADKILARDVLAGRALALAESRLEAKRAVPWGQLLFDDLDHDGVPETSMRDDGSGGDHTAGDGVYSAMLEQQGMKVLWTVAAHPPGPIDSAGAVVIEARAAYAVAGGIREVRLATLRANSSFTGTR
jgi:hypothetical protein